MEPQVDKTTGQGREIAIIGLGMRFPKADDLDQFWQQLLAERCLISEVPAERWSTQRYFGAKKEANNIWGSFIDDVACFDASFFRISRREAELMDPQQRIALELAWHAIEDSGYRASAWAGANIGVYIGVGTSDYAELMEKYVAQVDAYMPTGTAYSIIANRISHFFDFKGPSITLDTACASALTAIQQAVLGLASGECDIALAGALNLCLSPKRFIAFSQSGQLAKDGRSRVFDAAASGFVRGEGGAVLVLKPLANAIADRDPICGVIKGIGTRHGGRTNALTATNPAAQAELLVDVYRRSGVDPASVSYIEAHVLGALLGDPIEIQGLKLAFERLRGEHGGAAEAWRCGLGSVKANIGHLEAAAGMAGIVKVLAALKHELLPATPGVQQLNPLIKLDGSPFFIVTEAQPWPAGSGAGGPMQPRRAGVSTIGFGGVNGHIILEAAPVLVDEPAAQAPGQETLLIPLSARTDERLHANAAALLAFLQRASRVPADALSLRELAYTLQTGREAMEERVIFQVTTLAELMIALERFLQGQASRQQFWRGSQGKTAAQLDFIAEERALLIGHWLARGQLHKLAQAWVNGIDIDWELLYGTAKPRRIHAATYAFAKTAYWLPGSEPGRALADAELPPASVVTAPAQPPAQPEHALVPAAGQARRFILDTLAAALKLDADEIDHDAAFADYGLDSISGVALLNAINAQFGSDLATTTLFDHSSVNRLTTHILAQAAVQPLSQASNEHAPAQPLPQAPASNAHALAQSPAAAPIAIIGMSGRFAHAAHVDQLWQHLAQGRELIEEASRWHLARGAGTSSGYCSRGSFLADIDQFDALFFRISGVEATYMDPQQRFFLEEAWNALEDAGYVGAMIEGCRCGVYVGSQGSDYDQLFGENPPPQAFWGNSDAVIPARIAYFLNLKGPALAVNTACSSSLVAIHLACQGLWSRETDMALAGGVFIQSTPWFYQTTNGAGMVSRTGRCYAFDARADGFVPGEGVGAIVLKRLDDAIADGDQIYGVIKGSGINQDGKTNGLAAPSALAQEQLEREVYDRFMIDPAQIQMVEAHGTGTALGDPIEFAALTRAFRHYTDKTGYCAIGSIKTNIGHTTTAAGIAGVIKILLALKHKRIPPSLHFERGNPNIEFEASPFYVSTTLRRWHANGPRCAAISSFSFCGTNAHLVIEEAPLLLRQHAPQPSYLVVLSAHSAPQLQRQAQQLLAFVQDQPESDLGNISYTLLVGRRHFNQRLAVVVGGVAELAQVLQRWLAAQDVAQLYSAAVDEQRHAQAFKQIGDDCIDRCKSGGDAERYCEDLNTLADLFVQGYELAYAQLFGAGYRRIALPTYPFARERYWVAENEHASARAASEREQPLHPLRDEQSAEAGHQRFSVHVRGDEFFLKDHLVQGRMVLPGVVALELVRAALAQTIMLTQQTIMLSDLVWLRPVVVGEGGYTLHVALTAAGVDQFSFQITSNDAQDAAPIEYSRGRARLAPTPPAQSQNIPALLAVCQRAEWTGEQCYRQFAALGIAHGPALRGLERVHLGSRQALARVTLPAAARRSAGLLHPTIMDAVLQAALALVVNPAEGFPPAASESAALPFTLETLEIRRGCEAGWAHIRPHAGRALGGVLHSFDIDLYDDAGNLCVRMIGLTEKLLDAEPAAERQLIYCSQRWEDQARPAQPNQRHRAVALQLLLAGVAEPTLQQLATMIDATVAPLPLVDGMETAQALRMLFTCVFERLQALMKDKSGKRRLLIVVPDEGEMLFAPLVALLQTATRENPQVSGSLITLAGLERVGAAELARIAALERDAPDGDVAVRYRLDGQRQVRRLTELMLPAPSERQRPLIVPGGTYWITGGLGGLGRIFCEYLGQTPGVRVVLSGRSVCSAEQTLFIERLRGQGLAVDYWQADVTQAAAVMNVVAQIRTRYGGLNGIFHAAGVIRDEYILKKTPQQIEEVFAPKIDGVLNMDAATRDLQLDFMVLFSSIAGLYGSAGQADYSAANAFLDAFAAQRQALVAQGQRHGTTVAINWPLWTAGGMRVAAINADYMRKQSGMEPLASAQGLAAFETIMGAGATGQVGVAWGDGAKIRDYAGLRPRQTAAPGADAELVAPTHASPLLDDKALRAATLAFLKKVFAEVTKIDPARIKSDAPLEEYGLDSLLVMALTDRLEDRFGPLAKTLFFEYMNLAGVTEYFVENHRETLLALPALAGDALAAIEPSPPTPTTPPLATNSAQLPNHDIAIIGLAGKYPHADTLDAFWRMLLEGRDCFEPGPAERWDQRALYFHSREIQGKTTIKTGTFLSDIAMFDPRYFSISQRDAELMSPELRLLLQVGVEAFEDAGYSKETLQRKYQGDVGVLVGTMNNSYNLYGFQNMLQRGAQASGSASGAMPNMLSYFYGFTGPSLFIDTMCSSSSAAIHQAVQLLRAGECRLVLVGSVNLLLHPYNLIATSQEHYTSTTAETIRSYGLGADGTIIGEGVGAVVLKPLADAERDRDQIYGVIRGSGMSNAGIRNGFTVPNPHMQALAIEKAIRDAGIDPRTISYFEGHGSGTKLGDPVEIKGASLAFAKYTQERQFCAIGSVKSNVAHLLAASGLVGLTKVLLQMKHRTIVASLHAEELNPAIPFAETPFYVQRTPTDWPQPRLVENGVERSYPRRAGISSIGAGGMNVHLIVEEYQSQPAVAADDRPQLIVFSAMNAGRLAAWLGRFKGWLDRNPQLNLSDLAYTLQVGKNGLPCRLAVVIRHVAELHELLVHMLDQKPEQYGADAARSLFFTQNSLLETADYATDDMAQAVAAGDLAQLARGWIAGAKIDWDQLHGADQPRRLALPAYPFERIRCWYPEFADAPSLLNPISFRSKSHPFVGQNESDLSGLGYSLDLRLDELLDYQFQIDHTPQILSSFILDTALALGSMAGLAGTLALRDLRWLAPLDWSAVTRLHYRIERNGDDSLALIVSSVDGVGSMAIIRLTVQQLIGTNDPAGADSSVLFANAHERMSGETFYRELLAEGLDYRRYLETVEQASWLDDNRLLLQLAAPAYQQDQYKQHVQLPPHLLGALIQGMQYCCRSQRSGPWQQHLLQSLGGLQLLRSADEARFMLFEPAGTSGGFAGTIRLLNAAGTTVAQLSQVRFGALIEPQSSAAPSAPVAADHEAERVRQLEQLLREKVAMIAKFELDEIDRHTYFQAYGFDSIGLARLAAEVNQALGSTLTPAIFFECENIQALAQQISAQYGAVAQDTPPPSAAQPQHGTEPARIADNAQPRAAGPVALARQPIAIIGAAGRFPQSDSLAELWDNLIAEKDLISAFPRERYDAFYQAIIDQADFPKWAGVLRDVDAFDGDFFNISRLEAELMDPQHRLALETVWQALEESGYTPARLPANTGVYFGVSGMDYANLLAVYQVPPDAFSATGTAHSMLANRISYMLDIHGPSEPIDTACSSSLVAIHRAVESLRAGRCDMVIAGGVNLLLSVDTFVGTNMASMLSPDGRCKTFSSAADGYVRSEGVAALILKPLAQAEQDGDRILGLIIGSAENHGGRAGSLTAPNAKAQAQLIEQALAGIDPATISYIETHGTGTSLGDPVEINALKRAYRDLQTQPAPSAYCGLGSIKTNLGHLEAAAGVAGVLKVVLAMQHGELPATLHCEAINPYIELADSPFMIIGERQPWPQQTDAYGRRLPRRAGVSSFGFGGSNAHIVLEEYCAAPQPPDDSSSGWYRASRLKPADSATSAARFSGLGDDSARFQPRLGDDSARFQPRVGAAQLCVLSARNAAQLHEYARRLLRHLQDLPPTTGADHVQLASIAYTLQVGRAAMEARLALLVDSLPALREKLAAFVAGEVADATFYGISRRAGGALAGNDQPSADPRAWLREARQAELLQDWVAGAQVDWALLYSAGKPPLSSLPTYPFARERYWLPAAARAAAVARGPLAFDEAEYTRFVEAVLDGAQIADSR